MNKTVGTLQQFFNVLYRMQDRIWIRQQPRWKPSARAYETWRTLVGPWPPIGEKELSDLFPDSEAVEIDFSARSKVLYLPPLEKNVDFVPVLQMQCTLDEERTDISLKVMFVRSIKGDEKQLGGLGFRLESGEGRHDFYHAQLIRDFGWGPAIESPHWLPETQPSFPLAANCPVTLMLCLLLSLYGKKYCWTFVTEHGIFNLESHLKKINEWYSET
ncbi:MAG: hypothetical protein GY847_17055 [Proteobacteria bacterium]|nr:hypothetical protein [Pseudomonadota bacterium]